jgi:hypothetical protein
MIMIYEIQDVELYKGLLESEAMMQCRQPSQEKGWVDSIASGVQKKVSIIFLRLVRLHLHPVSAGS